MSSNSGGRIERLRAGDTLLCTKPLESVFKQGTKYCVWDTEVFKRKGKKVRRIDIDVGLADDVYSLPVDLVAEHFSVVSLTPPKNPDDDGHGGGAAAIQRPWQQQRPLSKFEDLKRRGVIANGHLF